MTGRSRAHQLVDTLAWIEDRKALAKEKRNHPLEFMLVRIDLTGLPWVRVDVHHGHDEATVTLDLQRESFQVRPAYEPDRPQVFSPAMSPFATVVTRHHPKRTERTRRDFAMPIRPENFDIAFGFLKQWLRASLGEALWSFVEVINEERAWKRIKWLRGEREGVNPWE